MTPPKPAAALALTIALLAGCAAPGDGPAAPLPDDARPPQAQPPVVYHVGGANLVVNKANPVFPDRWGSHTVNFNTTADATAIVVEVAWSDPTGLADLDAFLEADVEECPWQGLDREVCEANSVTDPCEQDFGQFHDCEGGVNNNGLPGPPDSPSRVSTADEGYRASLADVLEACADPCWWNAYAWARDPAADVAYDLYVSVFYGPVPEGYTALPA